MRCLYPQADEIRVSIKDQTLEFRGRSYPISSSQFGLGCVEGSNKTPTGSFQISEKFGDGEPLYACYEGRKKVGLWSFQKNDPTSDGILTRILRLTGMEKENTNTYGRYIYIHGTNDEEGIGQEKSIGCLRMRNLDIISLYNHVSLGTKVTIF